MTTKDQSMTRAPKLMTFASMFPKIKASRWIAALGLLATAMPALAQCPITFSPAASYFTGNNPTSVAVGYFNNDEPLDLAVTNANFDNVSILRGNADGTFQTRVNYFVGRYPQSVAVGDFNGDGEADLVVANRDDNAVAILRGNDNGTFQGGVFYAAGIGPRFVKVGDFNFDGRQDLAVVNEFGDNVSILLGNANGTFQAPVNYAVGKSPTSVVVGDFNNDNWFDLAVTNSGGNNVSILLGNPAPNLGTFQAPVNYAVGRFPQSVAAFDFNADGRPDLAVANSFSNNVSILLSNLSGTFQPAVNYGVGVQPVSVAVGDFNSDGRPDLAVANQASLNVSILRGNANGTFQAAVNNVAGSQLFSLVVGDFNADRRPDLIGVASNFTDVTVALNTTPYPLVVARQPASVSICSSGTAPFSVAVSGTFPVTNQWQWQPAGPSTAWAALSNGINKNTLGTPTFNVSGATTPSMNITSLSGLGGNFRCIVTNACGSVTSNEATLTICAADFNCNGFVNGDDFDSYIAAFVSGDLSSDFNRDGFVNGDDFDAFVPVFELGC